MSKVRVKCTGARRQPSISMNTKGPATYGTQTSMELNANVLTRDERAIFGLRSLYSRYGYTQYNMSKFEEYELYVRNKDFLVSDNIITFTDKRGRLMALKPDVTLSIVKNGQDQPGYVQKVYYHENVYRVQKGTGDYKEIMQLGLECIGDIDTYCIYEVLMLASESLSAISGDWILDVSHMGILSGLMDSYGVDEVSRPDLYRCIGQKNLHELHSLCLAAGMKTEESRQLEALADLYGTPETVLPRIMEICRGTLAESAADTLGRVVTALGAYGKKDCIRIDFSVINDMNYYNGIVFRGFVNGIPTGILSGGQYDKLMEKMGRTSGAIGFAVYMDLLERLDEDTSDWDVDTVILYKEEDDLVCLRDAVRMLTERGQSVLAQKTVPEKLRFRQLLRLSGKGVEIVDTHA